MAVAARYREARTLAWLAALRNNANGHVYSNNAAIVAQVNAGQPSLAVIDPFYWYQLRDQLGAGKIHSAVHLLAAGDPGYVLDVSGCGILKSSRHQAEAQKLLAFMVSRQGKETLGRGDSYEYPLASGVRGDRSLVPSASLRPDPITPGKLGSGELALRLLQQAGLL